MKILLLGEYSRLHNSLKEGLLQLGHQVTLVGTGDDFKAFPSDIDVSSGLRKQFFSNAFWTIVYKISKYNRFQKDIFNNLMKIAPSLKNYDVVQLINEDAFAIYPDDEILFFKKIFQQNKRIFLSACGEDSHIINYYKEKKMRYSILNPFENNNKLQNEAYYSYKYLKPQYKKLHNFVVKNVDAIIPSDMDYAIPYASVDKATSLIPNPVNIDKILFKPLSIPDKINIFFGINRYSFYKKGSDIILKTLKKIKNDFKGQVQIVLAENLPYNQYIKLYNDAHILIDQLYSYDQGFNALEAMAAGKCVITGAEKEFYEFYNLDKTVAINSLPDENDLYDKLSDLIKHKDKIIETGKNARQFIEQYHHYVDVARQYVDTWNKKSPSKDGQ
jgi:glycosyltransferase involved in cell wall biosynthesis